MKIQSVAELISKLGGQSAIFYAFKEEGREVRFPSTIGRWKDTGLIPVSWWRPMIRFAASKGFALDAEKLLTLTEGTEIDV